MPDRENEGRVEFDLTTLRRPDADKAKRVILEIIAAAGGEFSGKTRLYKAFWYAHLYFWEEEARQLTSYPIVHLPFGPGIDEGEVLLADLVRGGALHIDRIFNGPFPESRYRLSGTFPVNTDDPVHRVALKAVEYLMGRSATEISQCSHEESRAWQITDNGKPMDIYLDFLSDDEFQRVRNTSSEVDEWWNASES